METVESIFKSYGFISGILISLITYFGSRFLNLKDKKVELKNSLFQQLKVESINNFIDCYSSSELCWIQIPFYDILGNKLSAKEIDEIIIPTHNKFMSSYYKLFIMLDEKELKEFTAISESIWKIKRLLSDLTHLPGRETISSRADNYFSAITDTAKANEKLLKTIGAKFRSKYN